MRIEGLIAFVSGANRGLGKAFVEELLAAGCAKVYAGSRNQEENSDSRIVSVPLDVTSPPSVEAAAGRCKDTTLLINNAGIMLSTPTLSPEAEPSMAREMDVNVYGPLRMVQAFAPILRRNGGGAIVNMLSISSWCVPAFSPTYAATKHAAMAITIAQRMELRSQGTLVIGAYAGGIDTSMIAGLSILKTPPRDIAKKVLDGVRQNHEIVLCDERARQLSQLPRSDRADELLQQQRWDEAEASR